MHPVSIRIMCSKLFLIVVFSAVLILVQTTTAFEGTSWGRFTNFDVKEEDCNDGGCLYGDVNLIESGSRRRRQFEYTERPSYACLIPDWVPCSYHGHSYYNCRNGANANPYTRGCDAISNCYRFTD